MATESTKYFPVQLCTTSLAQSTSQYYFLLQPCEKHFYYKAYTDHLPVLLCTTKLARNTSKYYFVLQSLHKALPSTTLYYRACRNYFPVLLCTTKLAQSTSQYYFVLRSLHKQSTSQYYFVLQSLHKGVGNCGSKTGSRRQSDKKTILKHFLKGIITIAKIATIC